MSSSTSSVMTIFTDRYSRPWALWIDTAYKAYNIRDVETEMQIQEKLAGFPVPDAIWEEYHIDQKINDRGIRVDMLFVQRAIVQAAKDVGLEMKHSGVKRLMQNPRYLGDDFYPAILTAEIAQAVEAERLRRDALYKGTRYTKKAVIMVIPTRFSMKRTALKYEDPIKQAEYAYSQIKEVK